MDDGGPYMCPKCGINYEPWKPVGGSATVMRANKVYVYPADLGQDSNKLDIRRSTGAKLSVSDGKICR